MENGGDVPRSKGLIAHFGEPVDTLLQPILKCGPEEVEGDVEDTCHNEEKGWKGCPTPREDGVDAPAAGVFFALLRFHHRVGTR